MKIDVYLEVANKVRIGTLLYKNRQIYFEYDKKFLTMNIEISPYKLPLKSGLSICEDMTFDGLWGVFDDSLPDGLGKLLMNRHLKNIGINPTTVSQLQRLSYIGKFGVGAITYLPSSNINLKNSNNIDLD